MNFDAWVVNLATGTATHESGFLLKVEGDPRDPSAISPSNFPSNLPYVDQARLMRCGVEFLAKAAVGTNVDYSLSSTRIDVDSLKSQAVKDREALAKQFADRTDKPERSLLSLKKNK